MGKPQSENIKDFYATHSDRITQKRAESPYVLRRYVHAQQYETIAKFVEPGMTVLDAGCGEGVLSFLLADRGAIVTGCDISRPNIEVCNARAAHQRGSRASFVIADSEDLPFPDNSFDLVVSSHVLEHLPNFDRGLEELMRVTKGRAVVAIPTICNPCSLVQVGHGWYYLKGPRSFLGFFYGLVRLGIALVSGAEGVDETYGGGNVPHVFRFPSVLKHKLRAHGYRLVSYEASSVCLPYFNIFLPLVRWLDAHKGKPILRDLGYGTTYLIEK